MIDEEKNCEYANNNHDNNSSDQELDSNSKQKPKDEKPLMQTETNLEKNMSMIFNNSEAAHGLSTKETPLVYSTTHHQTYSPLCRQVHIKILYIHYFNNQYINSTIYFQSIAALGSIIATLSAGMASGYSATLLPQLNKAFNESLLSSENHTDNVIPMSQEISSWIGK